MLTFWGVVVFVALYGAVPAAVGVWAFDRWRARRRNRRGECAACGTAWTDASLDDRFLIQGRLVCADCGKRARRRMLWQFAILGLGAAAATAVAVAGADPAALILLPPAVFLGTTVGAVQLMKFANRRAQRRIAAGKFPGLRAEGSEKSSSERETLPPGPTDAN